MMKLNNTTIVIFSGDDSQYRSNQAGIIAERLEEICDKIIVISPYCPERNSGFSHQYVEPLNYSQAMEFQVKRLYTYVDTEYLLHCETDGFPIHFDKWLNEFYDYDYIGAPWPEDWNLINGGRIGNMGCSLIKTKFLKWVASQPYNGMAGDVFICQHLKHEAGKAGFKYAPLELAIKFSFENKIEIDHDPKNSFAFHNKFYEVQP